MDTFADPRNDGRRRGDPRSHRDGPPRPPEGGWAAWYLRDEDDVGESTEQGITVRTLLAALTELARERGWARTLVAGDQFFAWVESEPLVRISPDVYLLDDPPTPPYPAMWRTWLEGQAAPRFAVEVVSDDWAKDYIHAPRKYDQLGTRELVVFDPEAALPRRGRRIVLQMFRRDAGGALVRVEAGEGPVHSAELDAWLVVQRGPAGARLRIARDASGTDLVATSEELVGALGARVGQYEGAVAEFEGVVTVQRDLLEQQNAVIAKKDALVAKQDAVIAKKDVLVAKKDAVIAKQDALVAEQNALVTGQAALIAEQAAMIARLQAMLARKADEPDE